MFENPILKIFAGLWLCAAVLPTVAVAQDASFYDRKGEGWFWYQDPDLEPEPVDENRVKQQPITPAAADPKPPKAVEPPSYKRQEVEPFSVEWLQKQMPVLLGRAIDDPTKENVEAYLYAQRVAMDKAQRYANQVQMVVANDPYLDENNRVPLSSFAKKDFLRYRGEGQTEAMEHLSKIGGLWVFFDSTCAFCPPQVSAVRDLAREFGFLTKFISMNGEAVPGLGQDEFVPNGGQAQRLGLRLTPTTVFVVPPDNYYILSQGMMSQDQLRDRLIVAADYNGLLPEEILKKLRVFDRGVLSTEDMKAGAGDDPGEWVRYLKERLSGQY